jgi:K+-sensing histidine kinase KdpD
VLRIEAPDVLTGLERAVRERGATHLVLGHGPTAGMRRFLERPLADRLLERMPAVEVHLVASEPQHPDGDHSTL